jgi:hypothetical protein
MRGLEIVRAHAAEVAVAMVIGEDDDEVGFHTDSFAGWGLVSR